MVHGGKGILKRKRKVKIPREILMGTEKVISVKSGMHYTHTYTNLETYTSHGL
jgi:hypothetical protein